MNGYVLLGICLGACGLIGMAGSPIKKTAVGHKVVFEFVGDQAKQQEALLNNVENVIKALGAGTQVLVVAHGDGLALLHHPEKALAARMEEFSRQKVVFAACENTMRRKNLSRGDLLPFAVTVDSGVAEVVRRQADGWRYIKSG